MSAINRALADLSTKSASTDSVLVKAEVKPVKSTRIVAWVVASFTTSLAVGGWAISQQVPSAPLYHFEPVEALATADVSPTSKTSVVSSPMYLASNDPLAASQSSQTESAPIKAVQSHSQSAPIAKTQPQVVESSVNHTLVSASTNKVVASQAQQGQVVIEHVALTPQQLADKASERAKKALDSNNLSQALDAYNQALRYTPNDSDIRQRLAALYYGKGEVRKAAETLQKGIALDSDNIDLRLALAKMLLKEQQNPAALTVLSALPEHASIEYLSLRAALAQKQKQDQLALESYSQLVEREPQSGRWWLGLAIQQERAFDLAAAKSSYRQALTKLGISSQSQQFIRDRLALIGRLEEQAQ
ncbi:tetratricopeptide repeat protein [Vibrio pacinii]|uniref:tetratricopeptide repeat protein n=1 Tax=Vibrio pacinii TaxID=170674 RepID=UPI0005708A5A|nr:tetratricopeptide repeat protein [Vibrio pacinii]